MLADYFIPRLLCALTLLLAGMVGAGTLYAQPAKPMKTRANLLWRTELVFWESIKDSTNPDEFEAYLSAYPDGHFASLARIRMQTLKDKAGISASSTAQRQQPVSSLGEKVGAKSGNSGRLEPGKVFRDCDVCPALVVIPSGHFEMGTSKGRTDEMPLHAVDIPQPFAIGVYEVTEAEWGACVQDGICAQVATTGQKSNLPIANVSWTDTQRYLNWLSDKTGQSYRLPSEAEWEYAARGGTITTYWWGNDKGKNRANCADCGSRWDGKGPSPVGSFEPNPFGLYDVHGNVWEWTQDCWHPSYQGAPSDGSPWTPWTQDDCLSGVLRGGGSWGLDHDYMRASRRSRYDRDVRYYQNGFRVVRELSLQGPPPLAEAVQAAVRSVLSAAPQGTSGKKPRAFVIDPLIDGLSGLATVQTQSMESAISKQIRADYGRFKQRNFAELGNARVRYVLIGTFTGVNKEHKTAGVRDEFRICLTMLDLGTNKVIRKAKVFSQAAGVDITPTAFFRDSPAWMIDPATRAYVKTCQALPLGDPIDPVYLNRLNAASVIHQAIEAYDSGQYAKAKKLFARASHMKGGEQVRTYNGLYLTNAKLGEHKQAAEAFRQIVDYGLANHGFAVNFPFRPDSTDLVAHSETGKDSELWLNQIAQAAQRRADCLEIVGHTSRTGPEALDERLSIRRAELIKQRLAADAPALSTRMIATGKGSQENLVGSRTEDARDALDRRIEFQPIECAPAG